ncbi:MAG TPA: hypothetical protein VL242_47235 [Sorangium sp.]|nr:hypothetical protein [Sorangium sp.]
MHHGMNSTAWRRDAPSLFFFQGRYEEGAAPRAVRAGRGTIWA